MRFGLAAQLVVVLGAHTTGGLAETLGGQRQQPDRATA